MIQIIQIHILLIILFVTLLLSRLLTESRQYAIANRFPELNRKPFNCRPCLNFHLIWLLSAIAAWIIGSIILFIMGIILAFAVFAVLYLRDRWRIED